MTSLRCLLHAARRGSCAGRLEPMGCVVYGTPKNADFGVNYVLVGSVIPADPEVVSESMEPPAVPSRERR